MASGSSRDAGPGPRDAGTVAGVGKSGDESTSRSASDEAAVLRDAVQAFGRSRTGGGAHRLSGPPEYRRRYADLATRTARTMASLHAASELGFADFAKCSYQGMSTACKYGDSKRTRPLRANVQVARELSCSITAVSSMLAHESAHLANGWRRDLAEEVACHMLEACYLLDLKEGVPIKSEVHGGAYTVRFDPTAEPRTGWGPTARRFMSNRASMLRAVALGRLVDWVIGIGYGQLVTAQWVRRNIDWYGGVAHRTANSPCLIWYE